MSDQPLPATAEVTAKERAQLRRQMAIQHQVELAMNQLIQNMTSLVDETAIANSRMEKHQIKNLLAVALETPSVEVVKHYIFYQMGRDGPSTSWRYKGFGQKLIERLDGLRKTEAQQIIRLLPAREGDKERPPYDDEADQVWLLLVRAYLGQLYRYFYYHKEKIRWPPETNG